MRNNLIVAITVLLFLTACEDQNLYPPAGYVCASGYNTCAKKDFRKQTCDNPKRASFIISCAKAANPMSDEEGEDLVAQCEKTSTKLFCEVGL